MARTVGIEEELLLVDREDGRPVSVASSVLRATETEEQRERAGVSARDDEHAPGGDVTGEFQQQQVETGTPPRTSLDELEKDLATWRDLTVRSARESGARVLATGTSPLPVTPTLQRNERYERLAERFGLTAAEHLVSGCHVHVSIDSPEEGVGVLDRALLEQVRAGEGLEPFEGREQRHLEEVGHLAVVAVRAPARLVAGLHAREVRVELGRRVTDLRPVL